VPQLGIGRVGDRVDFKLGYVGLQYLYLDHRHIVAQAPSLVAGGVRREPPVGIA
jgi:hypothetical protein